MIDANVDANVYDGHSRSCKGEVEVEIDKCLGKKK
jgi:hypothetical protein